MKINIVEQFNQTDLDVMPVCKKIAEDLDIAYAKEVELNFSECLIGYDSTCIVIDKVIQQLIELSGKKTLTIICDYKFPLDIIATLLFCGSKFVDDNTAMRKDSEMIRNKLRSSLSSYDISIFLLINGQRLDYFNE